MPTESKKKKSHKDEKKSLLSIKKEEEDVHPLEHYVDDRIDLIKQIFGSLKSKTIESIIPEFLQEKSIDEIQEICLEEILGISRKRLLSIINATKCPTDTESSDSEVEKIEEHISLEEISSDSNDELNKTKRKKKRTAKGIEPTTSKAEPEPANKNGDGGEKKYSVLELLELQARARAIRSQLALEPVTKIELDDSDTEQDPLDNNLDSNKESAPKASQINSSRAAKEFPISSPEEEPIVPATKPLRLKRNFRQRQMEGYESDENRENEHENVQDKATKPEAEKGDEKEQDIESDKANEKDLDISAAQEESPKEAADIALTNDDDVVPIVAEPEILCISSSDSENETAKPKKPKKSYITMPVIEKVVRPPTADELFLLKIKEKSEQKAKANDRRSSTIDETRTVKQNIEGQTSTADSTSKAGSSSSSQPDEEKEMEDGEIIDDEEILEVSDSPEPSEQKPDEIETKDKSIDESTPVQETEKIRDDSSHSESGSDSEDSGSDSKSESESDASEPKSQVPATKKINIDDDDEDIIDLGKDEDLDLEQLDISTASDEPKQEKSTRRTRSKNKKWDAPAEVEPKDESWDKRWLRGNKVSKVLATAKLANKVRSKIKEKKTKSTMAQKPEETTAPAEAIPETAPSVEVGSVEHYKELTKQK